MRTKGYVRNVDDFALFHNDQYELEKWCRAISRYLDYRRLQLHPQKTFIVATRQTTTFLGFILLSDDGDRRLPQDNVRRFLEQ